MPGERCIVADGRGGVIVGGNTTSTNFPTTHGAYDTTYRGGTAYVGGDCFITHLNSTGSQLLYSTYLGGSGDDILFAIALDSSGGVLLTGETNSLNFPTTPNAYDTTANGNIDAFVVHLNNTGSRLIFSTLIGGSGYDAGNGNKSR